MTFRNVSFQIGRPVTPSGPEGKMDPDPTIFVDGKALGGLSSELEETLATAIATAAAANANANLNLSSDTLG